MAVGLVEELKGIEEHLVDVGVDEEGVVGEEEEEVDEGVVDLRGVGD
jgi:hypothetical protein